MSYQKTPMTYQKICAMLAARNCFNGGASVTSIAAQAKVSRTTVRRWVKATA